MGNSIYTPQDTCFCVHVYVCVCDVHVYNIAREEFMSLKSWWNIEGIVKEKEGWKLCKYVIMYEMPQNIVIKW